MEIKVDALVLRTADYGESDRMLTLFTLQNGKLSAAAKGVRKAKARLNFAAQPFCFGEYVLAQKGERYTVISAFATDAFYGLRMDIGKLYAAASLAGLCDAVLPEGLVNEELFLLAVTALGEMCEKEETEALLRSVISDYYRSVLVEDAGSTSFNTKLEIYAETMGTKILVLFLGIYLGIIFLLTSAAVLALQQLSQAADNQERYAVLTRLGVEEKMRDRSVYVQVFLAFFLPLFLAVIHSVVGMTAANNAIAQVGQLDSVASSAVTAVFILVVYGAYFLATCWGSRRIVRGR